MTELTGKNGSMLTVMEMVRELAKASEFKGDRRFRDLLASRMRQAFTLPIVPAMQKLAEVLGAQIQYVRGDVAEAFLKRASQPDAARSLAWMRQNPQLAAMVATMKEEADWIAAIEDLDLPEVGDAASCVDGRPTYDISIEAQVMSPLAHGADAKAGNATMFRRCQVRASDGTVMSLPFYAGNAIRGQMRDLLADDLLGILGLGRKSIALWFFYAIYSGGALEEGSKATEAISAALGKNGALRTDGLREFRDVLPALSVLGAAMGNRVLSGRMCVGDLRPVCRQWGFGGDAPSVEELFDWQYLTRREDDEAHVEHHGMIATTECMRIGTHLVGGIDCSSHICPMERSALGRGIDLLTACGKLGAENRRGFGKVDFVVSNAPDASLYVQWLDDNKERILSYLHSIGALVQS